MKRFVFDDSLGYGSHVRVFCEKSCRDSDETNIDIDFSKSSFPDIFVSVKDGKLNIHAHGAIEQGEILEAFKSVVKMLEA